jgi:hypothetical protein
MVIIRTRAAEVSTHAVSPESIAAGEASDAWANADIPDPKKKSEVPATYRARIIIQPPPSLSMTSVRHWTKVRLLLREPDKNVKEILQICRK